MPLKFLAAFAMVTMLATGASAQTYTQAQVDSLIDHFVKGGNILWPNRLFVGCPRLESWQEYGFRRLASMELTRERENDLAHSWYGPLRLCGNRQLEQWYLDHFTAVMHRGELMRFRGTSTALKEVDSPLIREYFWNLTNNMSESEASRGLAAEMYFIRLTGPERVRDYLKLFEAERLPSNIAWGIAEYSMDRGYGTELIEGVSRLVRLNPALALQPAIGQVVSSSGGRVDQRYRQNLADALDAALAAAPGRFSDEKRRSLQGSIGHLRRPVR